MAKYTQDQIATIILGRSALAASGHEMPTFDEQIMSLTAEGGYEKLSEKEQYWINRWFKVGTDTQQKQAKDMQKYLAQPAKVADIYTIVGASLREMFGPEIGENPQCVSDMINLCLAGVHTLQETLIEKGVVTRDELKEWRANYLERTVKEADESSSLELASG